MNPATSLARQNVHRMAKVSSRAYSQVNPISCHKPAMQNVSFSVKVLTVNYIYSALNLIGIGLQDGVTFIKCEL